MQQGAEARLYETTFCGLPCMIKERFPKKYRLPELDRKITMRRTQGEARMLVRCSKEGIPAPAVLHVDKPNFRIFMERIPGLTLKEVLWHGTGDGVSLCRALGHLLARLHNTNIVHGDLTTSNVLLRQRDGKETSDQPDFVLVDFGLSVVTTNPEEKAVDLYVLERAFLSTHPDAEELIPALLEGYEEVCHSIKQVKAKLEEVRLRGRKRSMVG